MFEGEAWSHVRLQIGNAAAGRGDSSERGGSRQRASWVEPLTPGGIHSGTRSSRGRKQQVAPDELDRLYGSRYTGAILQEAVSGLVGTHETV